MKENYPLCEKKVLDYEGSTYTDGIHPYDPGGPTRWGITITDVRMYVKPNATAEDVKNLPIGTAMNIYKSKYWDKVNGDSLPSGLDETVFDYGVNSGIGRAGKVLRRCVGCPTNTSTIDNEVLAAVAKRDVVSIIVAINDERLRFLQSLAIWPTYRNGWTKRVNDVRATSLSLANKQTPAPSPSSEPQAKGKIPPPTKTITNTAGGAAAGGAAIGATFFDWVKANPLEAIGVVVGLIAAISVIIYLIKQTHKARQETPMNLTPLPEKK